MSETSFWKYSADLSNWMVWGVCAIVAVWFLLILFELPRRTRGTWALVLSGAVAAILVLAAVLRPVQVQARPRDLGPSVLVLLDASRRLGLPAAPGEADTRGELASEAITSLREHYAGAQVEVVAVSDGELMPWTSGDVPRGGDSELARPLAALVGPRYQRPDAVVLVSDGRISDPASALVGAAERLDIPFHNVRLAEEPLQDAAIRSLRTSGVVVAHQPFTLGVEVACAGGLECGEVPVTVRDVATGRTLARAVAKPSNGVATASASVASSASSASSATSDGSDGSETLDLELILDRLGPRVLEVTIDAPKGDEVPENNRRFVTLDVTRDRVRILHIAGRPTYDVRALRRWLERDESLDVVAFFILRDRDDNPQTFSEKELALIPFPVDELFTTHLSSFDAVILQDIDANKHQFSSHLRRLAKYVRSGGGLILVGGPEMFAAGGYAGTPIESVMPVTLPQNAAPFGAAPFVPRYTDTGSRAPLLAGLRSVSGERLPEMRGSNVFGPARKGAWVLWDRPWGSVTQTPMPVLSVWEVGEGRSIVLGVNDTQRLAYGEFASESGGRGYDELWQGLVGWLMRDPRYEMFRISAPRRCVADEPFELVLHPTQGAAIAPVVRIVRLGDGDSETLQVVKDAVSGRAIKLAPLPVGAYAAVAESDGFPAARLEFACEHAGGAWRDSRPDPERLVAIADAIDTTSVDVESVSDLPLIETQAQLQVTSIRPVAPAWIWALAAGVALGIHWLIRRRADAL
jgi:uncharacterized membrane protein